MADVPPPEEPATVELARPATANELAAREAILRDALPGLEPERGVTDWGRSERVAALADRTLIGFLYHYWFRVEAEDIGHVPSSGGALLVANHSGRLALDAAMIEKAVRAEHPAARRVQTAFASTFATVPGLGMALTKLGAVGAHPANLRRLLFDERRLVLVFPEAPGALGKPLRWRYRLRRFADASFVESAVSARVPIVPVCVLGAEEATPTLAAPLRRLPLGSPVPLPAKFRLRFLQPIRTDQFPAGEPASDRSAFAVVAQDIRSLLQENLLEMVGERRSVWLG